MFYYGYIKLALLEASEVCKNITFDQEYDLNTSREITRISLDGFQKYATENIHLGVSFIQTAVIPDIVTTVSGYQLTLRDIKIQDCQFPDCYVQFDGSDQSAQISVNGINFTLVFQFTITQQHYPYFSDSGNGTILLLDTSLTGQLKIKMQEKCQGIYELYMPQFSLYIDQLVIKLESPNDYIYQGIIQLLIDTLKDLFNTALQQPLYDAFINVANDGLASSYTVSLIRQDNPSGQPGLDQRYQNFTIYDQYFDSADIGLSCFYNTTENHCYGTYSDNIYQKWPDYRTNDQTQYYWHIGSFQSQFNLIYNYSLDKTQNSSSPCNQTKYVNTGLYFVCYTLIDDNEYYIEYLANLQVTGFQVRDNLQLILFNITNPQILSSNVPGDESTDWQQEYLDSISFATTNTTMSFTNGNYVEFDKCYYIQWQEDWSQFCCNFTGGFN